MPRPRQINQPVKINLHIPREMRERLVALSNQTDVPMSALVRRAIAAYLDQRS